MSNAELLQGIREIINGELSEKSTEPNENLKNDLGDDFKADIREEFKEINQILRRLLHSAEESNAVDEVIYKDIVYIKETLDNILKN